ncbi:hypothetical protein Pint_31299 [Pistacia integerrima]|uniref:Uncharacterized protein n=1 Tax=Pistacia integerrima TaxID=434235 RepID=A0ACC0XL06_9ROSI|nr:hypothetical protein Pint_31299 [Pistacia integerrima]
MLAAVLFLFPFIRRFLERFNFRIIMLMMWWSQPRLYVGRGMLESTWSLFNYEVVVSYYIEIKPLVGPTKDIMSVQLTNFEWHEFFPNAKKNIGVVLALWAPIILVYFTDAQIWYAIFSAFVGGIYGAFCHLGEIRTLGMLRSRFESLPGAFNACLIPDERSEPKKKGLRATFSCNFAQILSNREKEAARFSLLWNKIISTWLLLVPYWADRDLDLIQWPPFLLANKDQKLKNGIETDPYMSLAIKECYASLKNIIMFLVRGDHEKKVIEYIFGEGEKHIEVGTLIKKYKMSALPSLYEHFVKLIKYLLDINKRIRIKFLVESTHGGYGHEEMVPQDQLFTSDGAIIFPIPSVTEAWKEKIKRFYLLLTTKESAMDVPFNLEARRRISFFSNSLFMDMPLHLKFATCFLSRGAIVMGMRVKCLSEEELRGSDEVEEQLHLWASYRGQTLARTVRGMMSYRKALELQAFLDMAQHEDLTESYKAIELNVDDNKGERSLVTQCQAVPDIKFTYVVSCQQYGIHKRLGHHRAQDILRLMTKYPSLRVAYIDEVKKPRKTDKK